TGTAFGQAPRRTVVVLGHGAGGDRRTPFLVRLAEALAAGGRGAVLYNFPYTDRRGRRPDPPAVLEMTARAAAEAARELFSAQRVVTGGKSMGGRIASQVAAGGGADGLVFLGYPLHPPAKPEQLRDAHLPAVRAPMLFVQGTRDAFARWDLLEAVLRRLGPQATLHAVEGGDHSFKVPARAGVKAAEVEARVQEAVTAWLDARGL
ncbi:MAG TPA: alpha/beta family hydrolase, partial [Vicinamibacteria bacterium]|nr:alpha/beta family hydrolase [Vicinamibacteria bacterium]